MKLLIDMNLSPLWIPFLKQNGFEGIHKAGQVLPVFCGRPAAEWHGCASRW